MKISRFETTGIIDLATWLEKNCINYMSEKELREILKNINVSFCLEGINRIQSTLICELGDSYVQQSQRYVTVKNESYILPKIREFDKKRSIRIINKAFTLYEKMSQIKNNINKSRPKIEDFLYGIPIEDARYILPLATKTNLVVAMSGDKLIEFYQLINSKQYRQIFYPLIKQITCLIPSYLLKLLPVYNEKFIYQTVVDRYYLKYFDLINFQNNMVLLSSFKDLDIKVGQSALISTLEKTPSGQFEEFEKNECEKIISIAKRVLGYGHESIAEQARTTFGMMCSMVAYHQQLRHRLSQNFRENINNIILDISRPVIIPKSISNSIFCSEYLSLVDEYKKFRIYIARKYGSETAFSFILNCEQIKIIISTNARIDAKIIADRTCFNAQWEIRNLAIKKLKILRKLSKVLYENALPSCVFGVCKEGKLTCGRQHMAKKQFLNIN